MLFCTRALFIVGKDGPLGGFAKLQQIHHILSQQKNGNAKLMVPKQHHLLFGQEVFSAGSNPFHHGWYLASGIWSFWSG